MMNWRGLFGKLNFKEFFVESRARKLSPKEIKETLETVVNTELVPFGDFKEVFLGEKEADHVHSGKYNIDKKIEGYAFQDGSYRFATDFFTIKGGGWWKRKETVRVQFHYNNGENPMQNQAELLLYPKQDIYKFEGKVSPDEAPIKIYWQKGDKPAHIAKQHLGKYAQRERYRLINLQHFIYDSITAVMQGNELKDRIYPIEGLKPDKAKKTPLQRPGA
jgi:hypothetical protein